MVRLAGALIKKDHGAVGAVPVTVVGTYPPFVIQHYVPDLERRLAGM